MSLFPIILIGNTNSNPPNIALRAASRFWRDKARSKIGRINKHKNMKRLFKLLITIILFFSTAFPVEAQKVAGHSAEVLKIEANNFEALRYAKKKLAINKILTRYNSPLTESLDSFLTVCLLYKLDCYLLPSIAGLESTFGNFVLPNSNNPFGWGGGYILFNSWESAITTVGRGLKVNYIDKGANTVEKIAPIYAESTTWAPRVQNFINMFAKEEANIDSILQGNQVKL